MIVRRRGRSIAPWSCQLNRNRLQFLTVSSQGFPHGPASDCRTGIARASPQSGHLLVSIRRRSGASAGLDALGDGGSQHSSNPPGTEHIYCPDYPCFRLLPAGGPLSYRRLPQPGEARGHAGIAVLNAAQELRHRARKACRDIRRECLRTVGVVPHFSTALDDGRRNRD